MDTYGQLVPGQEADAAARMRDMMTPADAQQATDDESGAARTRTWNQRIMSPVRTLMALRMT